MVGAQFSWRCPKPVLCCVVRACCELGPQFPHLFLGQKALRMARDCGCPWGRSPWGRRLALPASGDEPSQLLGTDPESLHLKGTLRQGSK